MPAIHFFEEDTRFTLKNKALLRQWIIETIAAEGYKIKELNYIFCSDAYLLQINKQYLDHDTLTDIITFDNSADKLGVTGDIFISIDRVRENARLFTVTETHELHRVMIHGVLHLLGYKDKTPLSKQKMTQKEDHYLTKRTFI